MEREQRLLISTRLLDFLERRDDIHFRSIEKALEMPRASLKVTEGMLPKKWTGPVANHIRDEYGFDAYGEEDPRDVADAQIQEMEDDLDGDHLKKRRWSNGKPEWKDGVARFRDVYLVKGEDRLQNNGLWKRYRDWAYIGAWSDEKAKKGEMRLKKGWDSDGEIYEDSLGEYTVLTNGVKVYRFVK